MIPVRPGGANKIDPYILSTGECEHLNRKSRHEIGREVDQMDFATRRHTLQGPVIARNDNSNKVGWHVKYSRPSVSRFKSTTPTHQQRIKRYSSYVASY